MSIRRCLYFIGAAFAFFALIFLPTCANAGDDHFDDRYSLALYPSEPLAVADIEKCNRLVLARANEGGFLRSSRDQMVVNYWDFLEAWVIRNGASEDSFILNGGVVNDFETAVASISVGGEDILTCMTIAGGALGEMPFEEINVDVVILDEVERAEFRRIRERDIDFFGAYSDGVIIDCTALSFQRRQDPGFMWLYSSISQELVRRIASDAIVPAELNSSSEMWQNLSDLSDQEYLLDVSPLDDPGKCVGLNNRLVAARQSLRVQQ